MMRMKHNRWTERDKHKGKMDGLNTSPTEREKKKILLI